MIVDRDGVIGWVRRGVPPARAGGSRRARCDVGRHRTRPRRALVGQALEPRAPDRRLPDRARRRAPRRRRRRAGTDRPRPRRGSRRGGADARASDRRDGCHRRTRPRARPAARTGPRRKRRRGSRHPCVDESKAAHRNGGAARGQPDRSGATVLRGHEAIELPGQVQQRSGSVADRRHHARLAQTVDPDGGQAELSRTARCRGTREAATWMCRARSAPVRGRTPPSVRTQACTSRCRSPPRARRSRTPIAAIEASSRSRSVLDKIASFQPAWRSSFNAEGTSGNTRHAGSDLASASASPSGTLSFSSPASSAMVSAMTSRYGMPRPSCSVGSMRMYVASSAPWSAWGQSRPSVVRERRPASPRACRSSRRSPSGPRSRCPSSRG